MTSPKTTIEAAKLSWIGRKTDQTSSDVTRAVSPTPAQPAPTTRRGSSPSRFRPSSPTALNSRSFGADSYQVEFLKSKSLAINTDTKDPNTDLVKNVADCDARCALTVGDHIWVGERDGNISVRRILDGTVVHIIERRKGTYVFCLIEVGSQVWAGCSDGFIRVLSQSTYRLERQLARHAGGGAAVQCLAYHAPSQTVFSGSNDFEILAWNAQTYTMVRQLAGHGAPVRALLVVSNYLYSGADDAAVMYWDIPSSTRQGVWLGHTKGVHALAVSVQGHIWSGSEDGTIRIWNPANGETVGVGEVHTGAVNVLTTVGDKIWSGSGDTLCLWDAINLRLVGTYVAHNGYVNAITVVQKATLYKVWTLGSDRNAKLWRTERLPDEAIALTNKLAGLEELQYERDRLQEALKAREDEIKRLLIDLADSEERIRVLIPLEGLNATLRGDAAALLADNATLKAHAASLELAVADLRDSHTKLIDDNTALRTSILGSQRDAHSETYRAEIRALEATKAASQFQRDSDSLALQVQTLQIERQKLLDRIAAQEAEMDVMVQRLRDMDVVFKSRLSLITDVYKVYRKLEALEKQGKGAPEVTAVLGEFRGTIGKHFSDPELAHLGASRHFFPDETAGASPSARRSHSPPVVRSPTITRSGN